MGKIIAIHSYKGGTGKTLLSSNLAATLIKRGKKVCLLGSDVDGTRRMLGELYDLFEKKTEIVLNKAFLDVSSKAKREEVQTKIQEIYNAPLLGVIPCFCDVLRAEGNIVFVHEKPEHPLSKILDEIADKIDNMA